MVDVRKRYEEYNASWRDLPSIAPHPESAPGFTTGGVLYDLSAAADEITRLRAALYKVVERSHDGELGTSKVIDMRRVAEQALKPQ
ncbi:hypothetical protein TRICHSKD4_3378 [Roseibium sp. TrichSKD4]|uniref:hypothetical protein n=1 Tax=Roseibium sp. TrichSKD4 TaxID=744980 RepID=UPI0001E56FD8|nr:hypothetical protein [Roseibium sp. TrichSKD4]EFO31361.1 hypothetical protein TRICHSKD4_3378 [Roseibium sp. TrichSKD4]